MKKTIKLLLGVLLFFAVSQQVSAQKVYSEIMRLSRNIAKDKSKDIEARKIATFKVDELNYMAMKTKELMPDSSATVLDVQAYAMYDFINLFMRSLGKTKKPKDRELIITKFSEASLANKRFNDDDHSLVLSYCNNPKFITRFSLDTDWVKALREVKRKL